MKHKFGKSMRIVTDLVSYCYHLGSLDYHIDMKLRKNVSVYKIVAPIPNISEDELQTFIDTLNTPRQHEVEQNYWGLSGDSETDVELTLVGMMLDEAMVEYKDGVLTIVAKRVHG